MGVNIDITPRVHHDGDVTLALKLEISSVGPLLPEPAHLQQPHRHQRDPAARRRDQHPGRPHQRRGAHSLTGLPGLASVPSSAGSSRATATEAQRDRHRDDADAAHRAPHGAHGGGPAVVLARRRDLAAAVRGAGASPGGAGAPTPREPRIEPIRPPAPSRSQPDPSLSRPSTSSRIVALLRDPRTPKLPRCLALPPPT